MNQIFRFKKFSTPGWLTLIFTLFMIVVIVIYVRHGSISIGQYIGDKYKFSALFLMLMSGVVFLFEYLTKLILLKTNSYLEIKDGLLSQVIFSKIKWSVPINSIKTMDDTPEQRSNKGNLLNLFLGQRGGTPIGLSFKTENKIYQVKPFLKDFENFKQTIINLNPSIKFENVTIQADKDFNKQDLGKALQENANESKILNSIGKLISKLNFASAFIIGSIITLILIVWAVVATK